MKIFGGRQVKLPRFNTSKQHNSLTDQFFLNPTNSKIHYLKHLPYIIREETLPLYRIYYFSPTRLFHKDSIRSIDTVEEIDIIPQEFEYIRNSKYCRFRYRL